MRVLAVVPHPDDESYAMGGTLARCAAQGHEVVVLCLTWGEAGGDANLRRRELAEACAILGAREPVVLGWLDAQSDAWCAHELVDAVRELAPALVLGLGDDGVYGHRDHLTANRMLRTAVGSLTPVPRLLETAFPPGLFAPVQRRLARLAPQRVDGAHGVGTAQRRWDVRVDVRPWAEHKRRALAAHASQLGERAVDDFLRRGLLAELSLEERFVHAAGPALPRRPGAAWVDDPLAGL